MTNTSKRLADCAAAFPALTWRLRDAVTLLGESQHVTVAITSLGPRSWGWRMTYAFVGDVYVWPAWELSARFAFASHNDALRSLRESVRPVVTALAMPNAD